MNGKMRHKKGKPWMLQTNNNSLGLMAHDKRGKPANDGGSSQKRGVM